MAAHATVATELLVPALRELERQGTEVAARAGESGLSILAAAGLALSSFSDLTQRIPHGTAVALLDNAVRVSGDAAFGLHAGARVRRGDLGAFDLLTLSAETLRDSMLLAARYLPLLHDGASLDTLEQGGLAIWRHWLAPGLESSAAANEYVVAAFFFSARRAIGMDAPPIEVCFIHEAPLHQTAYQKLFQAPVRFACETNALVLPRIALDLPLTTRDAPLHAVLTRHADDLLKALPATQPFVERLRVLIRKRLPTDAALPVLAAVLHLSESSVQRRLQAEGTSYTEVLDGVRRELASDLLLDPDLNLSEIAYRLDFAHRPAFHRAFRRWHGVSPREYRARATHSTFYRFYRNARR